MAANNGAVISHHHTGRTTHIVGTHLTDSKIEKNAKGKLVKPEWIVESIARGKLLPWTNYRITNPETMFEAQSSIKNLLNKVVESPKLPGASTTSNVVPGYFGLLLCI